MKKLTLARSYLHDKTVGVLLNDEVKVCTLERPWLDNAVNISCIPEGSYIVKRDHYGRHKWFSVQDVEGRTFIELHGGVFAHHSNGCILIGEHSGTDLTNSATSLENLVEYLGEDDWMLTIRAATKEDWS